MTVIIKILFIILVAICLFFFHKIFFSQKLRSSEKIKFQSRFLVVVTMWIFILSALSLSGFLSDFSTTPPRMMIVFAVPLITFLFLLRSKQFKEYVMNIEPHKLILLQAYRIPVEMLLWLLYINGISPIQMTFEGRNFDILTGIFAPFIAFIVVKNLKFAKPLAIIFNLIGLVLLFNIVSVAILSFPTAFRIFLNEPANVAVSWFPIVFLPGILVPMAYYLHILSIRQLISGKVLIQ